MITFITMEELYHILENYHEFHGCDDIYDYPGLNINDVNLIFIEACYRGHLNLIEYLILNFVFDVHCYDELAFACACEAGHLKVIKFLIFCQSFLGKFDINKCRKRAIMDNHMITQLLYS